MPILKRTRGGPVPKHAALRDALASELRSPAEFGQPLIDEEHLERSGAVLVTVVWDRWADVEEQHRPEIIESAYRKSDPETAERITLAGGFTFPEAFEAEMLPYEVRPNLRSTDPVSAEMCDAAMLDLGASLAFGGGPVLKLQSEAQARRYLDELVRCLPESKEVWSVLRPARVSFMTGR